MTLLSKIKSNRFYKNISYIASASLISQLLLLLGVPITTSIYSPEQFGDMAIILLCATFFASFFSLRIEWSIPSSHHDSDVWTLFKIANYSNVAMTFIFIFSLTFVSDELFTANIKNFPEYGHYMVPLLAFFMTSISILTSVFTRQNSLKPVAMSLVSQSLVNLVLSIVLGIKGITQTGLVYAQIVSNVIANLSLLRQLKLESEKNTSGKRWTTYLSMYNKQVISSCLVSLVNFVFQNALPIFLLFVFSAKEVGIYYIAMRLSTAPVTLISSGLSTSFWGEAAELARTDYGKLRIFYLDTLKKLLLVSMPLLLLYICLALCVYYFYAGTEWTQLSWVILACLPQFLALFVFSSTNHFIIYDKQHYQLFSDIILFVAVALLIIASRFFSIEFFYATFLLSCLTLMSYLARFFLHLKANREMAK